MSLAAAAQRSRGRRLTDTGSRWDSTGPGPPSAVPAQRAAGLPAPPPADGAHKSVGLFSVLLSSSWPRLGRARIYPSSELPGDTASFGKCRTTENPHVIPQKYFSDCSLLIWLLFIPVPSVRPCFCPFNPDASSSPPQLTYLPPPWGECEAKALGFFHVYSVTACRIDCETRYIVENCNCRMVHMPGRQRPWRMPAALRSPCSRRCFCCRRRVLLHT